jgi:hypothetical protein
MLTHTRILTLVSCAKMHDHGGISVKWTWDEDDPFALTLHAEGTDDSWQLDLVKFSWGLTKLVPGTPRQCGIASLQLRASNPAALSMQMLKRTEYGEAHAYLICSVYDVVAYLETLNGKGAPTSYSECDVDSTLEKILNA